MAWPGGFTVGGFEAGEAVLAEGGKAHAHDAPGAAAGAAVVDARYEVLGRPGGEVFGRAAVVQVDGAVLDDRFVRDDQQAAVPFGVWAPRGMVGWWGFTRSKLAPSELTARRMSPPYMP